MFTNSVLFTDDSILFAKAGAVECGTIKDMLEKYEAALGQRINLQKMFASFKS